MAEKKQFRTTIGGQALIEGILMRGPEKDAIVVRAPEGLVTKVTERKFIKDKYPILGLPVIRGAATFLSSIVTGVKEKRANDAAPVLTVEALVKTKRMDSYHTAPTYDGEGRMTSSGTHHTSYYATFEVESGDRLELQVSDYEYGQLAEGDRGKLTFQRKRFLKFERERGV